MDSDVVLNCMFTVELVLGKCPGDSSFFISFRSKCKHIRVGASAEYAYGTRNDSRITIDEAWLGYYYYLFIYCKAFDYYKRTTSEQ